MRTAAVIAWFAMSVVGGLMGLALVVSDEPGATAGRWHLGFAALGVVLGVWGWRLARTSAGFVIASVAVTVLIAVQAYWIGDLVYLGLTNILMVIAALATILAVIPWLRER